MTATQQLSLPLPKDLANILTTLPNALVVGGAVRDCLLGINPKDIDVEVYAMEEAALKEHLTHFGKLDEVGKAFGVLKLTTETGTYDFSLPRRDSKNGTGHRGFTTACDPTMSPAEAALRRDITINSMAWNPKNGELIDHHGGLQDLESKIIRHTSVHFPEDPLRPLRCFQFASRFEMTVAPETAALCQQMAKEGAFQELPIERIEEEFTKFLLKGINHNYGFKALKEIGWSKFFPEIEAIYEVEQDQIYHPEGTVITHTGHCLTALRETKRWKAEDHNTQLLLSFSILAHDLGKATTTKKEFKKNQGRIVTTSNGHEAAGVQPTIELGKRIGIPKWIIEPATLLVMYHLAHTQVKTDKEILKLATQLSPSNPHAPNARVSATIRQLAAVMEADHSGRPPLPKQLPENMEKIVERATVLQCLDGPQPTILNGKTLASEAIPPGQAVGEILKRAYKAQISGEFSDEKAGLAWIRKNKRRILTETKLGPTPLINGNDLIKTGIPPGPDLTRLGNKAYELQLAGKILSKEDALKALRPEIQEITFSPS